MEIAIKIDGWLGRTLFIPPIIRVCQLTRLSQFALSKYLFFVSCLDLISVAQTTFNSLRR